MSASPPGGRLSAAAHSKWQLSPTATCLQSTLTMSW